MPGNSQSAPESIQNGVALPLPQWPGWPCLGRSAGGRSTAIAYLAVMQFMNHYTCLPIQHAIWGWAGHEQHSIKLKLAESARRIRKVACLACLVG